MSRRLSTAPQSNVLGAQSNTALVGIKPVTGKTPVTQQQRTPRAADTVALQQVHDKESRRHRLIISALFMALTYEQGRLKELQEIMKECDEDGTGTEKWKKLEDRRKMCIKCKESGDPSSEACRRCKRTAAQTEQLWDAIQKARGESESWSEYKYGGKSSEAPF